ncbi:MAG: pyruvate water dikinase [Candidatus Magasanikbacteria bacterium GW2011_GWA2_56_11]|uniref:Pyruvate water dikinase n=1 Tax=Candidatus Magasanikbacteria bacterium GW2011_GWA2_56_11 TaxID=1619044 RepID=A0A0G2BBI1_9BACT|nr:MAG: pyruvate water dikinase [Candidatus Magasanikbacteria bacterium GW2011_GWA2_56_11]
MDTISEIKDAVMPSLTEWLQKIGHRDAEAFRAEDNAKRDRLEVLYQTIGLNYDRPERLTARDITDRTPRFAEVLKSHGDRPTALRLIPYNPELPKLRVRGKTLKENLIWFSEQAIDPDQYRVEVIPHPDGITPYAAIFLINDHGAYGEIVPGWHWQLTQGINDHAIVSFAHDFSRCQLSEPDPDIQNVAQSALDAVKVADPGLRAKLQKSVAAEFTPSGHIKGYFEFVVLPSGEIQFIDYNRLLYTLLKDARAALPESAGDLTGICACPGMVEGRVRVVTDPITADFNDGDILVCPMTMVEYVPLMKRAGAIITDRGNILSHAAIVSRELRKPCIVGTKTATSVLRDGQLVRIDAAAGSVFVLAET